MSRLQRQTQQIDQYSNRRHQRDCAWLCVLVLCLSGLCLLNNSALAKKSAKKATKKPSLTLRIQLSPALCALDPKRMRMRQCREGFAMTVYGLRPDPQSKGKRCSHTPAYLPPLQSKVISRIMPDKVMRDAAWQYYGACMGVDQLTYFRLIAQFASQLKVPQELSSGNSYVVNRDLFEQQLGNKNTGLSPRAMQLICRPSTDAKSQVLTELQVCYDSAGKFSACQQQVKNPCPADFVIRGLP